MGARGEKSHGSVYSDIASLLHFTFSPRHTGFGTPGILYLVLLGEWLAPSCFTGRQLICVDGGQHLGWQTPSHALLGVE